MMIFQKKHSSNDYTYKSDDFVAAHKQSVPSNFITYQGAIEHQDYTNVLVRKVSIAKWILKSKNN